MADGVDAAIPAMEHAARHAFGDRGPAQAQRNQLLQAGDSVLPRGERRKAGID